MVLLYSNKNDGINSRKECIIVAMSEGIIGRSINDCMRNSSNEGIIIVTV